MAAEDSNNNNNNGVKKPAAVWNKPVCQVSDDVSSHVIGDVGAWPALSEAAKVSSKTVVDNTILSNSQGNFITNPKKNRDKIQNHSNAKQNHKPNTNQTTMPARHRSKRGGGSGPSQNGNTHHPRPLPMPRPKPSPSALRNPPPPPPPPPLPTYPIFARPYGPIPPPMPFLMPPSFNGNNWERGPVGGFSPQPIPMNDQSFQATSNPRANFVGHPNGDGTGNNGNVSRRDHQRDRSSSHKGFAGPSRPRAPPPPPVPFFPMGYDMAPRYVNFPAVPPEFYMRYPPPLPLFVPAMDPDLPSQLIKQIDHYFSDNNLAKDSFLRARMDDEGWVDIAFIAAFPKVQQMTQNIQLILDSLNDSTVVEVQGNRIRRRNDWRKWTMAVPHSSTCSSSQAQADSAENMLTDSLKGVVLDDKTNSIDVVACDGDKADSSSNVVHSDVAN